MRLRPFLSRHRLALLAILASAAIHASLIVGIPGRIGVIDEPDEATYSATLDPAALDVAAAPSAAPRAPRRAAPRARKKPEPPRPDEIIAQAPQPAAAPAPEPEPEGPPEPDLPPEPPAKPETVALAPAMAPQPPTPLPETEPFPTRALPGRIKITYALNSSFADGRAVYEWERDGDDYVITGEAHAEGFFTLFLEGRIYQESRGKVTAEGLRPDRFSESRPSTQPEGIEFKWDDRKVVFERNGEKNVADLRENTVDWLTMIFQLAHRPPKGDSFDLRVYTQRRLYQFKLKVLGEEMIDIPIGKVRALHMRHFDEEKNESVDVWLGVDQHYVPVKLRYPVARNRIMVEQTATRISAE